MYRHAAIINASHYLGMQFLIILDIYLYVLQVLQQCFCPNMPGFSLGMPDYIRLVE